MSYRLRVSVSNVVAISPLQSYSDTYACKVIVAEGARLLRETLDSPKSGSGLISPDKHKMNGLRRRSFAFLVHLSYDLEGLAAVAG
jgi:hypothetical protein